MPLQVIVVGAGIGGLCTAVALQQAGHSVKVFEKSRFAAEVGAALLITPNGERVLSHLNFDFARARADAMHCFEVVDGVTMKVLHRADLISEAGGNQHNKFGAPFWTVHRVDLHNELLRLTSNLDIRLGAKVVVTDTEKGMIQLADGSTHFADLIVGADGLHSVLRGAVLGDEVAAKSTASGMSAFRFMLPTKELENDDKFEELRRIKGNGNSVLADTTCETERHMIWYTCRGGTMQNFAGIHQRTRTDNDTRDVKAQMLEEFGHYHPSLTHILSLAPEVTDWPLSYHDPLPFWHRGKTALIGDAAHPMLPFGAQGANQAIEDAGALGALFTSDTTASNVPARLELFESVRRLRASRVQTMSRVRLGKEKEVEGQVRLYTEPGCTEVPSSFEERQKHDYEFDVYAVCEKVLAEQIMAPYTAHKKMEVM